MKIYEVFTPGKFPEHTYINEHLIEKERLLRFSLESGGNLISISGPSKSGKTVFIEQIIGKDNLIQISGSSIKNENDVWKFALSSIGTPVPASTTSRILNSTNIGSNVSGKINFGVAQFSVGINGKETETSGNEISSEISSDYLNLVSKELKDSGIIIFIDDFHYIDQSTQGRLANQIKELIRRDIKIICASVPYHSDDALRANTDLQGRIQSIDFEYWQEGILKNIAYKGAEKLNIVLHDDYIERIAKESSGSPQLMQSLCLYTCFALQIEDALSEKRDFFVNEKMANKIFSQVATTTDFSSIYSKILEGPRTRGSERKSYQTTNGKNIDVYGVVLDALALDPPTLTIRYNELTDRVQKICQNDRPPGSSIISACGHIADIAKMGYSLHLVEWDDENDVFEFRDPYFLFYLRWSQK